MNGSTLLEFDEDPLQFGIQEAGGTVYLLKAQSRGEFRAECRVVCTCCV